MLSKKCVPIATTLLSFPSTEVTPLPIVVSLIRRGYPTAEELSALDVGAEILGDEFHLHMTTAN